MQKELSVTYHAPKGESKMATIFGQTFFDGKAEKVVVSEGQVEKLKANKFFECGEAKDYKPEPPKHEPPPKEDAQHDHKADQHKETHKGR